MSSLPQSSPREEELRFLESLRLRYEKEGFVFLPQPAKAQLPKFLGSYVPDAIAKKPGHNVAVEVKRRQSSSAERTLRDIRRLFDGHPDWQFDVVFMGADDPLQSVTIPTSPTKAIRIQMKEVRTLIHDSPRAAFIMAWSLLEAALRASDSDKDHRPRTPGTVVQTLAMLGYIEPELEQAMRNLIVLRNRIVHGDLAARPDAEAIELILSAIEATLKARHSKRNTRH